ncbi:MAG: bifunctional 4-hydroxy-2-oxoglutarate aldolase/2-dehydro-3-deoxy-phosphogluconate aldolase [Arsenophonus sp.]|nr:bifunctional 4-hydroxy-2-oxoglutarate aldolase/2-dehydro-3-deoxy-phosphogluconate aldolase [Arsenophonus sp.]
MLTLIDKLRKFKIIPVITIERAQDIVPLGEALVKNGLPVAEITFRTPAADAIKLLKEAMPNKILIGAGTIINREQIRQAEAVGAEFIVSPGLNPDTVKACHELDIPIILGINNPTQIEQAMQLGINCVKFFPAEPSGGLSMLKALLAPYPKLEILPTGGINLENIGHYLTLPQVIACGGSWMVNNKLIKAKDWDTIGQLTRQVVKLVK